MYNDNSTTIQGEIKNDAPLGIGPVNPQTGLEFGKNYKIDVSKVKEGAALYRNDLAGKIYTEDLIVPKSIYRVLGDEYHPEFDPDYNAKLLSASQTKAGKFVAAMNQAVVGEIFGGSIEGLGYLLDIPMMMDLMEGTEQEFGNAFTKFGQKFKTWAEDTTPVFTDPTAPKFNPVSFEWWMKNLPSIASTASLAIPSMAGMKGLQALGKITGVLKETGELGKFSKLFGTAFGQAVMSRHMENLMEASGVYQQGLDDAKGKLYEKYNSVIEAEIKALPVFTPVDPEVGPKPGQYTEDQYNRDINNIRNKWEARISEEANTLAAMGASSTYAKNWVLLLQDIPQYMLFNKLFKPGAKTIAKQAEEQSAAIAKRLGYDMPKFYASKAAQHAKNLITEGLEEQYQFLVNKQSAEMIKRLGDPEYKNTLLDVLGDSYDDGEFWTNGFFGALGAGFMQAAFSGLNAKALANSNKARLKQINSYSELLNKLHADYVKFEEDGDEVGKEHALENFIAASALRSIDLNTKDHLLNLINALSEDDTNVLSNYEINPEARGYFKGRKDITQRLSDSINNLELKYKDAIAEVTKRGVPEDNKGTNRNFAREIAHSNYMLEFLNGKLNETQSKLKNIKVPGYNEATPEGELLSEEGRQRFALLHEKSDLTRRLKNVDKRLSKQDLHESDKVQLTKEKERYDKKLAVINQALKDLSSSKTLSKEQLAIDNKLLGSEGKQDGVIPLQHKSAIDEYAGTQRLINSYQDNIDYFKDNLEGIREVVDKLAKKPESSQAKKTPTEPVESEDDTVIPGSIVNYKVGDEQRKGIVESIEYATKDSEGKDIVPSGENVDNIITIVDVDTKETVHVTGIGVSPISKEEKADIEAGLAEDDTDDVDELIPAEQDPTAANKKQENKRKTNTPNRGLIEFLSYTEYDKNDKLVARDKKLDEFLSDPENQKHLATAVAEYSLELDNKSFGEILTKIRNEKGGRKSIPEHLLDRIDDLRKGKKVDDKDIKTLLSYEKFLGNVPIKVKLTINGKSFSKGLYVHRLEFVKARSRNVADYKVAIELRRTLIQSLLKGEKAYTAGFSTNRGNPLNIDKTNSPDARKVNVAEALGVKPKDLELYILKSSTKFAKREKYEKPVLQKNTEGVEAIDFDFSSVGSVFAVTNKTVNGDPFAIKLNKSFISKEHAALIFNAFSTLAKSELTGEKLRPHEKGSRRDKHPGYYNIAIDPSKKVSDESNVIWNLSAGELLDLLVVHGSEATDPDSSRYIHINKAKSISDVHKLYLKQKRLFLERGYDENGTPNAIYLCYGLNTIKDDKGQQIVSPSSVFTSTKGKLKNIDYKRINLTSPIKKAEESGYFNQMKDFVNWMNTNKTYAVHLDNKMLGLKLNGTFLQGRSFRIGKKDMVVNPADLKYKKYVYNSTSEIVRKPGESYVEFLVNNGFVTTDIQPNEQGRLFTTPYLHLGFNQNPKDNFGITNYKPEIKQQVEPKVETVTEVKDKPIIKDKVIDKPKEDKSLEDIMNDDFTNLRERVISTRVPYEKQDLVKELAWVRKFINLDDDEIQVEQKLANMVWQGRKAWAKYSHASIVLYEAAETGTLYHEAFHRVSLGYFTKEERDAFYRSARLLYSMPKEEYSDKDVEEKLAEEFRDFVISKQTVSQPSRIKRVFQQILDFIRAIFIGVSGKRLTHHDIERLFNQIYSGRYRFSKVRPENLGTDVRLREIMGMDFNTVSTYQDVSDIQKYLAKKLLHKVPDLNNIKKLDWNSFIADLNTTISNLEDYISTQTDEAKINRANKSLSLLKDVLGEKDEKGEYPKFEAWRYYIDRYLRGIGIVHRASETEDETIYEQDDFYTDISEDEKSSKANIKQNVDYMKPLKNNALANVKFVVSTLPASEDMNESLGIVGFADGNKVWAKLLNDIIRFDDIDEMISEIRSKGVEENFYPYLKLADILENASENFRTNFQTAFEAHRHDFIRAIMSKGKDGVNIYFDSAAHSNLKRNAILKWNALIQYDSNIVYQEELEEGKQKIKRKGVNESFFEDLLKQYDEKVNKLYNSIKDNDIIAEEDFEKIFSNISSILHKMHIEVSPSVIRRYTYQLNSKGDLQSNLGLAVDKLESIIGPDTISVTDPQTNEISLQNIIKNDTVNALGFAYADVNTHEEAGMVLGPEGASFYRFAKLNLITDNLRRIKRGPKWAEDKVQLVYNRHSRILNSFIPQEDTQEEEDRAKAARDNFSIVTLSAFKGTNRDGGREYLKINPIEDYLLKAYAILNGDMLPFPIIANRQTYYFMKGVELIGVKDKEGVTANVIDYSNADGTVQFTDEVIDLFYNYYLDEKERVLKARAELREYKKEKKRIKAELAKSGADTKTLNKQLKELNDKLIRYYHYSGNFNTDRGNAYNFIHFKGFEKYRTPRQVKEAINKILNDRLQDDIKFCDDQQIISKSTDTATGEVTFYSKLIHENTISNHRDLDKRQNYAVLSVLAQVMVNTQMAIIESEKLFLGDPALFKRNNEKDANNLDTYEQVYKRWFGAGSTGTRLRAKYKGRSSTYGVAILNTQKFESSCLPMLEERQAELFEQMFNDRLQGEDKTNKTLLSDNKKLAKDLAKNNLKKYTSVDPTDGSAFISPEMYKEIVSRYEGWSKDKERAFQLLQSDKDLSPAEIIEAQAVVFSPLKTMYIGNHNFNGIDLLIYDKMAMFTLFRQHVKGTHLEELLDRMEVKGKYADKGLAKVHVFNFDSAIKVGGLNGVDFFKNKQTRSEVNDLSDVFVFDQSFDYLKHQQVVDPHSSEQQNFGTAGIKIGMSDIDKEAKYGEFKTGQELLEAITEARNAVSDFGIHRVNAKFGIYNGRIHNKTFIDMLRRDAEAANKAYDIIEALRTDPDTGEKYLELDAFNDRKWMYARIKTIVDELTIDLTTPGNQLVQMTDFGMAKASSKRDLKFIRYDKEHKRVDEMECRVSIRLFKHFFPKGHKINKEDIELLLNSAPTILGYRIPTQGQNSIVKLKVVDLLPEQSGDIIQLPLEFTAVTGSDFDIDKLYVAVSNYRRNYEKGRFTQLERIQFLDDNNSTVQARYVAKVGELFELYRKSPQVFGDVLAKDENGKTVPIVSKYFKEFVDLDSELHRQYERSKEDDLGAELLSMELAEKITQVKEDLDTIVEKLVAAKLLPTLEEFSQLPIASQNTLKANQNRILDILFTVLGHDKHFINVTTPLGTVTDIFESKSKFYERAYSDHSLDNVPALYTTTPSFQAGIKTKFSSSTFGIAPYALSNNHHSLTQMADIEMRSTLNFGWNKKGYLPLNDKIGRDNKYISLWISGLIDIHVDGVNKPIAAPLNINEATHDIINFLVRIGVGEDTFDFIAQPILQDYAFNFFKAPPKNKRHAFVSSIESQDIIETTYNLYRDNAVNAGFFTEEEISWDSFRKSYQLPLKDLFNATQLRKDALAYLNKNLREKEWYIRQLSILQHFKHMKDDAEALRNFVLASRVDTKKYGSNPVEILHFVKSIENVITSGKFTNIGRMLTIDPNYEYQQGDTFLPTLIKNSMFKIYDILKQESIYSAPGFKAILEELVGCTPHNNYNRMGTLNLLTEEVVTYFLGQFFADPNVGFGMNHDKVMDLIFDLGDKSYFRLITELQSGNHKLSKAVKGNTFLNSIVVDFSDNLITDGQGNSVVYSYIKPVFKALRGDLDIDFIKNDFRDLLYSEHAELRDLATFLYMYSFYTSAFKNKIFSFASWLPVDMNRELRYGDRIVSLNKYIKDKVKELNTADGHVKYIQDIKREVFLNTWDAEALLFGLAEDDNRVVPFNNSEKGLSEYAIKILFDKDLDRMFIGQNSLKENIYLPYVIYNDRIYEYVGYDTADNSPYYVVVAKKGFNSKGAMLHEYGVKTKRGNIRSILSVNNPYRGNYTINELIKFMHADMSKDEITNFVSVPLSNQIVAGTKPNLFPSTMSEVTDDAQAFREEDMKKQLELKAAAKYSALADLREDSDENEASLANIDLKSSVDNVTNVNNPIHIDVDGSSLLHQEGRPLGAGAYAKFGDKTYTLVRNNDKIRDFLKQLAERNNITVPDTISNPTAEMYAVLNILYSFKDTSEHLYIHNDNEMVMLFFKESGHLTNLKGKVSKTARAPLMNAMLDLAKSYIDRIESNGGSIRFEWVPNKTTEGNKQADQLAKSQGANVNDFATSKWGRTFKVGATVSTTDTKKGKDNVKEC